MSQKDDDQVHPAAHWIYMAVVLGGGLLLNLLLIAVLGGSSG